MATTLTLSCIKPGGGTFVVDGGRPGQLSLGVASGGPADGRAMAAANRLLSRDRSATCLEFALTGGQWILSGEGQFVFTGADMNWRLNGRLVEACQVQYLDGDGLLTSTAARRGLRSYLAINGNWDIPHVMGSAEAGLPGLETVTPGWEVNVNWEEESPFQMDLEVDQFYPPESPGIGVIPGPEWSWLSKDQQRWLLDTEFAVHPDSSRQGIRLAGPTWPQQEALPMLSSPVLPGTIQLSPSGPILLGPNAQTIGGYPRVLLVHSAEDLALAFQVMVGDGLRFTFQKMR